MHYVAVQYGLDAALSCSDDDRYPIVRARSPSGGFEMDLWPDQQCSEPDAWPHIKFEVAFAVAISLLAVAFYL